MPLPAEYQALQDRIETALTQFAVKLQARQATYFAARGRYWQGVRNPSAVPEDEAKRAVDTALKPTDQTESWATLNFGADLPAEVEFALAVSPYNGPAGHGYTLTAWVRLAGRTFRRTQNFGPENFRARGWHRLREPQTTRT
jgi:hypothetical protein